MKWKRKTGEGVDSALSSLTSRRSTRIRSGEYMTQRYGRARAGVRVETGRVHFSMS